MLLSKVFNFINTTLIRPRYIILVLPFDLLLGELVYIIILVIVGLNRLDI
jgi:hypothetical protein